jgi:hypothetical protein
LQGGQILATGPRPAFARPNDKELEAMATALGILVGVWIVGWLMAIFVIRIRAGVGLWHRLKVFGPNGFGLGWALHAGTKAMFWPVTLVYWLTSGRPEPGVVFNEKARRRQLAEHM